MHAAAPCAPRMCSARWELPDERAVTVRPVLAQDLPLASDFVAHGLTQHSRYQRFQTGMRELTPSMAAYLTDIDYCRHFALTALAEDARGQAVQVGEARYVRDADQAEQAEFALAVADAWQGRGLGSRLLRQLVRVARRQGLQLLYGDVLGTNQPMLALARSQGFRPQRQGDPRLVRVALALEPVMPPLALMH